MKKMIFGLLSVTTILIATAGSATAQGDKDIAFIPAKNHAAYVAFLNQYGNTDNTAVTYTGASTSSNTADKAAKASLKAAKANSKAIKNFGTMYKKVAPDATWSMQDDAMIASFTKDDVNTHVVYNKKGNWVHSLTYFSESKTPKDIAEIIDAVFPKDDIKLTVKVEEGNMLFYIVQLEGKTTLRKATVYNGEVNIIEDLVKSN